MLTLPSLIHLDMHIHTDTHILYNENKGLYAGGELSVGVCVCLCVALNRVWLAQQAHQTIREHREVTQDEVEEE